jgi:hypothetical protein
MKKNWNWMLLAGFGLTLVTVISFFELFARWPITRDFPWPTLVLFAVSLLLLGAGLWRAYKQPDQYRGKIFGPILTGLSLLLTGGILFYIFILSYQLPVSASAPKVGDTMPNIALLDQSGEPFELAQLVPAVGALKEGEEITEPTADPKEAPWVLLVFYRGHW